jgi:hypothetical protein
MSKLMDQHDQKHQQAFQYAPQQGRLIPRLADKIGDGKEPRPVQIDGDTEKFEQTNGAASRWHFGKLPELPRRNKFFGRISVAVLSPGFNRSAI